MTRREQEAAEKILKHIDSLSLDQRKDLLKRMYRQGLIDAIVEQKTESAWPTQPENHENRTN